MIPTEINYSIAISIFKTIGHIKDITAKILKAAKPIRMFTPAALPPPGPR